MADGEQDTCPQQLVPSQVVPAEALRGGTSLPLGGGGDEGTCMSLCKPEDTRHNYCPVQGECAL